jgi:hypothetical protein
MSTPSFKIITPVLEQCNIESSSVSFTFYIHILNNRVTYRSLSFRYENCAYLHDHALVIEMKLYGKVLLKFCYHQLKIIPVSCHISYVQQSPYLLTYLPLYKEFRKYKIM